MGNLIKLDLSSWQASNTTLINGAYKLYKGKMVQSLSLIEDKHKSDTYKLSFNVLNIKDNSFILINTRTGLEDKSFFVPILFDGVQEILIESGKLDSFKITLAGSFEVKDLYFGAYFEGLTEDEKNALIKVENNSDEWEKIKEITDNTGNVIAQKLQGIMHLNLVNIQNSTGQFIQNDNNMMWVSDNGEFASLWNDRGIFFATSKDSNGWVWQNAIGSAGVVATNVVAGAIDGHKITGAEIVAGSIVGGEVKGVDVLGSTIIGGNETDFQSIITPTEPLSFYNKMQDYKQLYFRLSQGNLGTTIHFRRKEDVGTTHTTFTGGHGENDGIWCRGKRFDVTSDGDTRIIGDKTVQLRTAISSTGEWEARNIWFVADRLNNYCVLGNHFGSTYIDGLVSAYNLQSATLSETEVSLMEVQYEKETLENRVTELEIRLLELEAKILESGVI